MKTTNTTANTTPAIEVQTLSRHGLNVLYRVEERDGKTFWMKVGTALVDRDGTLRPRIVVATGGRIVCRAARAPER